MERLPLRASVLVPYVGTSAAWAVGRDAPFAPDRVVPAEEIAAGFVRGSYPDFDHMPCHVESEHSSDGLEMLQGVAGSTLAERHYVRQPDIALGAVRKTVVAVRVRRYRVARHIAARQAAQALTRAASTGPPMALAMSALVAS